MELYSTHAGRSPEKGAKLRPERGASLLSAGEPAGHSVAEMAQRDLDTALQLLANRAQYITGASGAAIALRRDGKNDMLCRASTGSNAPELGALLSTEVGLSGESVRTRKMLRCDDAERDARVNREVCRQLGIASVVVMPVVNDDEVLGVFELFSGKANAFGARDVSAVQRLSGMVEAVVRLARATTNLPERLKMNEAAAIEVAVSGEVLEDQVLDGEVLADVVLEDVLEDMVPADIVLEEPLVKESVPVEGKPVVAVFVEERIAGEKPAAGTPTPSTSSGQALSQRTRKDGAPSVDAASSPLGASSAEETAETPKKKLYWSAAPTSADEAGKAAEPDQSHVPPVLRSLRKCEACGFPISAGRVLCVECEEKKWRGHLKAPKMVGPRAAVIPSPFAAPVTPVAPAAKPEARAFAAAAQSTGVSALAAAPGFGTNSNTVVPVSHEKELKEVARPVIAAPQAAAQSAAIPEPVNLGLQSAKTEFVLSAGLEPSQSWLSANKYVIGILLVIGGGVAALFFLR